MFKIYEVRYYGVFIDYTDWLKRGILLNNTLHYDYNL